jgi:hypothetical protein
MLIGGSAHKKRNYYKNLIDVAGKDGGFIMATRSAVDMAKLENLRAMIETTKTLG